MRFWIDENVHAHVAKALKQAGHEIRIAKRGTDDHPGKLLTKLQTWVFFYPISTSPSTSETFYKGLQSCTQMDSQCRFLSTEPHV